MKNKSLIIVFMFLAILFIGTITFANNDIKNGIHNVTDGVVDGVQNLGEDVRNGVGSAENAIEDGARDIGNAISNGTNAGNAARDNNGANSDTAIGGATNGGYTATRTTAADATTTNATTNMDSSLWTWIILAIAAVIIVGLVWYYASQNNTDEH